MITGLVLIIGLVSGQLIKIPLGTNGGAIILDLSVISLCTFATFNLKFKKSNLPLWIKSALLFILTAFISLTVSPLSLNISEYLTASFYILRFIIYIYLGWLIYNQLIPITKDAILKVLTISGLILASLGLLQLIFLPNLIFLSNYGWDPHYFRTVSTFLDPNFLGCFLTLSLIIIFINSKWIKKWKVILFAITFLALLTTFSRGAYLGFGAGFFTLSLTKKSLKTFLLTIILSTLLLSSFYLYQKNFAQPRNINRAQSAKYRLNSYQQGLAILEKNPIFGIGFNAYRYALKQYNMGDEQFLKSHGASSNDSSLLFVLATTGVFGFIFYIIFLISLFWAGLINYLKENWGIILLASFITIFVQSFFSNTLFYPPLLLWLIFIASKIEKS